MGAQGVRGGAQGPVWVPPCCPCSPGATWRHGLFSVDKWATPGSAPQGDPGPLGQPPSPSTQASQGDTWLKGPRPPPGRGGQPRAGPSPSPGDRPYCLSVCHCGYWNSISHSDMSCAQNQPPSPARCPLLEPSPPCHQPPSTLGCGELSPLRPQHQTVRNDPGCSRLSARGPGKHPVRSGPAQHRPWPSPRPCSHPTRLAPRTQDGMGFWPHTGGPSCNLRSGLGRWAGGRSACRPCLESPAPSTLRPRPLPHLLCLLPLLSPPCPWALCARTSSGTCSRTGLPGNARQRLRWDGSGLKPEVTPLRSA